MPANASGKTPVRRRPHDEARSRDGRSHAHQRQAAIRAHQLRAVKQRRRQLRWISLILAFLLVIAASLWLVWFSLKKIEEHAAPPDPARAFDPVPCQLDFLTTELSREGNTGGQPIAISVSVKNTGSKVPCSMETSASDFKVTINTGDIKVFDSETCEAGISAPRLLLDKGVTTTQTFTWNGMYGGKMCGSNAPAAAGSYVANVYYMGEKMTEKGLPFQVFSAPVPAENN